MPLDPLLSWYPLDVSTLLRSLREFLLQVFTRVTEEVNLTSRILAYRIARGMKVIAFTIIPSQKGVKMGIPYGTQIADPNHLLEGSGKLHKVIPITSVAQLETRHFSQLIRSNYTHTLERIRTNGKLNA